MSDIYKQKGLEEEDMEVKVKQFEEMSLIELQNEYFKEVNAQNYVRSTSIFEYVKSSYGITSSNNKKQGGV